jgi:nitrite reductase/ring-hydroxylating ferredoxin subunit
MSRIAVARLDELRDGIPRLVDVGPQQIVVVRWRDQVAAVRNICPHQGASLVAGRARSGLATRAASEHENDIVCGTAVFVCPWHAWEFDLTSGECRMHNRLRLRVYTTVVEDGTVYVTDVAGGDVRATEAS